MRRLLCALILVLAFPAGALAQSDPFTPPQVQVPQPTPQVVTPTPPPNQDNTVGDPDDEPSRGLLFGIAGLVALLLAGIAYFISRDARRNLTDKDKRAIEREGQGPTRMSPQERKQRNLDKRKQRQRDKRQRQARKAQRRR